MCNKIYYSEQTSYVFIGSNTEEGCDKRAKKYFNLKKVKHFINVPMLIEAKPLLNKVKNLARRENSFA